MTKRGPVELKNRTVLTVWAVCWGLIAEIAVYSSVLSGRSYEYALQIAVSATGALWVMMGWVQSKDSPTKDIIWITAVWCAGYAVAIIIALIVSKDENYLSMGLTGIMLTSATAGSLSNAGAALVKSILRNKASRDLSERGIEYGRIIFIGIVSFMVYLIAPYIIILFGFGLGYPAALMFKDMPDIWSYVLRTWFLGGVLVGLALCSITMSVQDVTHDTGGDIAGT